jgi:hypothetical protein
VTAIVTPSASHEGIVSPAPRRSSHRARRRRRMPPRCVLGTHHARAARGVREKASSVTPPSVMERSPLRDAEGDGAIHNVAGKVSVIRSKAPRFGSHTHA